MKKVTISKKCIHVALLLYSPWMMFEIATGGSPNPLFTYFFTCFAFVPAIIAYMRELPYFNVITITTLNLFLFLIFLSLIPLGPSDVKFFLPIIASVWIGCWVWAMMEKTKASQYIPIVLLISLLWIVLGSMVTTKMGVVLLLYFSTYIVFAPTVIALMRELPYFNAIATLNGLSFLFLLFAFSIESPLILAISITGWIGCCIWLMMGKATVEKISANKKYILIVLSASILWIIFLVAVAGKQSLPPFLFLVVYIAFVPALIAYKRGVPNFNAIITLNGTSFLLSLFLIASFFDREGKLSLFWSILLVMIISGWVGSCVWAMMEVKDKKH